MVIYIAKQMNHSKKINFIDIFCGAGGLSFPFKNRGHNLTMALDIDSYSIDTFRHNLKSTNSEIYNLSIQDLMKHNNIAKYKSKVDLVMGGPPCQGFSTANRQNIINDPRNRLYKHFLKFVGKIKPKFVLIENVIGIKNKAKDIIKEMSFLGYDCDFTILQASEYGLPQNRKRLFFFGIKKSKDSKKRLKSFFDYLNKIREKQKDYVLEDALYGLRKLKAKKNKNDTKNEDLESGLNIDKTKANGINSYIKKINFNKKIKFIYNHKARYNNSRDINIFKRLPQGGDSTHSSIQDIMPYKRRSGIFKDKYFKLQPNKVCKTITSHMKFDCNMYIHPFQARGLTPREAARVQGFSDDYFFVGPISKCYMQIGNAVPPPLSEVLCRSLEKIINA